MIMVEKLDLSYRTLSDFLFFSVVVSTQQGKGNVFVLSGEEVSCKWGLGCGRPTLINSDATHTFVPVRHTHSLPRLALCERAGY